ncbi:PIN domain-containing protein [Rhodopirellula bahusiensis]|uniref:Uncharacterized protein n=1 Tax=Rhodopirellula bahusiensis TaxID=2014065 RepID=A0A2G1W3S4_9BACT|nr:restriction endonuclease [Rhodopirellula bahusiensis]PHQ33673.1 hypothetical protein CEE69_19035 [Rhodopirellula bahusiensis]
MRFRYPHPGNEDEFEEFCVRFYRHLLRREGLVRYGKRGEKQDGIDIIDQLGMKPLHVIQCKNHEPTKTIPPKEINDEVFAAEASAHSIDRFIISTTARKSKNAQDTVLQLNQRNAGCPPFKVEIHFWEDVCGYLDGFGRAVAEFIVYSESIEALPLARVSRASYQPTVDLDQDNADELFQDIHKLFEVRKLEAAQHEIDKLPDPQQNEALETNQRYAILRLRAKMALETLQADEAIRLFHLAYETCPNLQQARRNRVLALEFAGDRKQALIEAKNLINDGDQSSYLMAFIIRNSETASDLKPYQESINTHSSTDIDVNIELAQRYLKWGRAEDAREAASKAVELSPDSAHAQFALGMVSHHLALHGDWQTRTQRLTKAIEHYSDAIKAAIRDNYRGLIPEILIHRARVNSFLRQLDKADADFRAAVDAASVPSLYAEAAVSFFLSEDDYESAEEMLPVLDSSSDEAAFLIGVTKYHCASPRDKMEVLSDFIKLTERNFDRSNEIRYFCVQWAIELSNLSLARECVPDSFVDQFSFQGNSLLAWIELESGKRNRAGEFAFDALNSSSKSAHRMEIAILARILVRLGEEEKALPLWEQAAVPGILNDDCKALFSCAQRLDRHDTLLRICSELRETGQQDQLIRKVEIQLLSQYQPEKAFELATKYRELDNVYYGAMRNFLAIRLAKLGEVDLPKQLASHAPKISPEEAYLVVVPLIETSCYLLAIDFLYHQLRSHFSSALAHGQFIWTFLRFAEKAEIAVQPNVVDVQSAVQLKNSSKEDTRWVVIEDTSPDPARDEFTATSPVAQPLVGKHRGDSVDLTRLTAQPHQERIVDVKSKYAYRFEDSIKNFQIRFPGEASIQSINMGTPDDLDPAPLVESLKERKEYVDKAIAFYHEEPCSLHLLATRIGLSEYKTMDGLTANDAWMLRCNECSPSEFDERAVEGFEGQKIVTDLSALVTITRLGILDCLADQYEFIVSRKSKETIIDWLSELPDPEQGADTYASLTAEGEFTIREVPFELAKRDREEIESIVSFVESHCEVRDSPGMVNLAPKKRKLYGEFIGLHSLDSIGIAVDEHSLLWTDDFCTAMIAETDFGVDRIWTQLLLRAFLANGSPATPQLYSEMVAKLAGWNYVSTVWNNEDVVAAGELCNWDINTWPLKQCLRLFRSLRMPRSAKARHMLDFFRQLRRSSCVEFKQTTIVQSTLNELNCAATVRLMIRHVDQFFPIDFPSASFLKEEFIYWAKLR